jgi:hypothetical protein
MSPFGGIFVIQLNNYCYTKGDSMKINRKGLRKLIENVLRESKNDLSKGVYITFSQFQEIQKTMGSGVDNDIIAKIAKCYLLLTKNAKGKGRGKGAEYWAEQHDDSGFSRIDLRPPGDSGTGAVSTGLDRSGITVVIQGESVWVNNKELGKSSSLSIDTDDGDLYQFKQALEKIV